MGKKSELKTKYKDLVRIGKIDKAQGVLKEIWELSGIYKIKKPKKNIKKPKENIKKKIYSKEDLEKCSFKKLKNIGKKFGTTDRSKKKLIKEILNLQ